VGPEFDFDVQLILQRAEVPPFQVGGETPDALRLGWNTWAGGQGPTPEVDDVVFSFLRPGRKGERAQRRNNVRDNAPVWWS
jgi:predicted component of type VI protein secretion system